MPATDVLQVLRTARSHATRNASVLDQISTPSTKQNTSPNQNESKQQQQQEKEPPPQPSQPSLQPPSSSSKQNQQQQQQAENAPNSPVPISKHILNSIFEALDSTNDSNDTPSPSSPSSQTPRNYVSVENHFQNHFLYGLVMPLIARLLATSSPGLLCVVQLPRPQLVPKWATSQTIDEYPSNGSNGSKSAAPTVPSPLATSGTPSRSDDANGSDRKSISPDGPQQQTTQTICEADGIYVTNQNSNNINRNNNSNNNTDNDNKSDSTNNNKNNSTEKSLLPTASTSAKISHTDQPNSSLHLRKGKPEDEKPSNDDDPTNVNQQQQLEKEQKRKQQQNDTTTEPRSAVSKEEVNTDSPEINDRDVQITEKKTKSDIRRSSDRSMQDHRSLRLVCNGFEVLTGKMPPPRAIIGSFTLASVGWDKAGVIRPNDSKKGVSMSFSNGMMTPTEGIVVTFCNGSMCVLTLSDPYFLLQEMKITDSTPIVVFSFAPVGCLSLGNLLSMKKSALSETASSIRTWCEQSNVFSVEVGHGFSNAHENIASPIDKSKDDPQMASEEENQQRQLAEKVKKSKPEAMDTSADGTSKKQPSLALVPQQNRQQSIESHCALLINIVPRAIPLFVNTINQTFIDGPYHDLGRDEVFNEYEGYFGGAPARHRNENKNARLYDHYMSSTPMSSEMMNPFDRRVSMDQNHGETNRKNLQIQPSYNSSSGAVITATVSLNLNDTAINGRSLNNEKPENRTSFVPVTTSTTDLTSAGPSMNSSVYHHHGYYPYGQSHLYATSNGPIPHIPHTHTHHTHHHPHPHHNPHPHHHHPPSHPSSSAVGGQQSLTYGTSPSPTGTSHQQILHNGAYLRPEHQHAHQYVPGTSEHHYQPPHPLPIASPPPAPPSHPPHPPPPSYGNSQTHLHVQSSEHGPHPSYTHGSYYHHHQLYGHGAGGASHGAGVMVQTGQPTLHHSGYPAPHNMLGHHGLGHSISWNTMNVNNPGDSQNIPNFPPHSDNGYNSSTMREHGQLPQQLQQTEKLNTEQQQSQAQQNKKNLIPTTADQKPFSSNLYRNQTVNSWPSQSGSLHQQQHQVPKKQQGGERQKPKSNGISSPNARITSDNSVTHHRYHHQDQHQHQENTGCTTGGSSVPLMGGGSKVNGLIAGSSGENNRIVGYGGGSVNGGTDEIHGNSSAITRNGIGTADHIGRENGKVIKPLDDNQQKANEDRSGKDKTLDVLGRTRNVNENEQHSERGELKETNATTVTGGGSTIMKKKCEKRGHSSMMRTHISEGYGKDGSEYCNGSSSTLANGHGHHHYHHHHHKVMKKKNGYTSNRHGSETNRNKKSEGSLDSDSDGNIAAHQHQQPEDNTGHVSGNGNGIRINGKVERAGKGSYRNNTNIGKNGCASEQDGEGGDGSASSNSQLVGGKKMNVVIVNDDTVGRNRQEISANGVGDHHHHSHHYKRPRQR